jgi:hypothetical protein
MGYARVAAPPQKTSSIAKCDQSHYDRGLGAILVSDYSTLVNVYCLEMN